jgi:phytoene dehydrogenase-like protein
MTEKSIIVIGAGIAGLSAGCYGRMNGYRVQVLEQDTRPGGLCTSWERNCYTIHGNMAFLVGSGPGLGFHRIWQELGVVPGIRMIDSEYFLVIEGLGGELFYAHADIDKLERHMRELAPEDRDVIDEFIGGVRIFARYDLPVDKAPELLSPLDKINLLFTKFPLLRTTNKWKKVPIDDFASRFKNPFLRQVFLEFKLCFSNDLPVAFLLAMFAWSHRKSFGFPEGGGLRFARAIENRFLELGGDVEYKCRAAKILTKNGRASGVRTDNGREFFADYVISAADGRMTIFDLLEGKYADKKTRHYYDDFPVSSSAVLAAFGVSRLFDDFPKTPAGKIYVLKKAISIGGREFSSLRPMIYNYDSTLAPPGKTLIRFVIPADYGYWDSLRKMSDRYKAEKEKIAGGLITFLDGLFPGLATQVEMWDVATPLTFNRYTGNWKGSMIGWDATTRTFFMPMDKALPGLRDFYMAGQWVEPGGGLPMVAASGRNVIQLICRKDKKRFSSATAGSPNNW